MDFGAFVFRTDSTSDDELIVGQRTFGFNDWTCGSATWNVTEGTFGWIAPVVAGQFTIRNDYISYLKVEELTGRFLLGDRVEGTWEISGGGTCTGSWEGAAATPVYLRYDSGNSTTYLSTQRPPQPYYYVVGFAAGDTWEWRGVAGDLVNSTVYSFSLYLASGMEGDDDGFFDVSLSIDNAGTLEPLAGTTFRVPYSSEYELFANAVNGQSGVGAGDTVVLRITFTGPAESESGELMFGYHPYAFESRVFVGGSASVSPLVAQGAIAGALRTSARRVLQLRLPWSGGRVRRND